MPAILGGKVGPAVWKLLTPAKLLKRTGTALFGCPGFIAFTPRLLFKTGFSEARPFKD